MLDGVDPGPSAQREQLRDLDAVVGDDWLRALACRLGMLARVDEPRRTGGSHDV
jgi:hypothetical protein